VEIRIPVGLPKKMKLGDGSLRRVVTVARPLAYRSQHGDRLRTRRATHPREKPKLPRADQENSVVGISSLFNSAALVCHGAC
jgi:hypothetical protein